MARREKRDAQVNWDLEPRLNPMREGKKLTVVIRDFIVKAEIQFPRAPGRRKLEVVSTAAAAVVDIPLLPEWVEVVVAKIIVQVIFDGIEDLSQLVQEHLGTSD